MCCFFLFQDIDQNGYDQNDTCDDLLPVCLQADIWKTCFQKHDDEDTNECTDYGTISTGSCYTTNEYTTDSIHLKSGTSTRLYSRCYCCVCDCCKTCKQTADNVYHYVIELCIDSRKGCCLFVGTDCNCVTTEFGVVQDVLHKKNQNDHPQETERIT